MDKLLPCPFCGGLPAFGVIDTEDDPNQGGHFVACGNPQCDATTGLVFACMDGPEQVLTEKWNRRTQAPADPEHLPIARVTESDDYTAEVTWLLNPLPPGTLLYEA